ncbi:hypothetical protein CVT25_013328 [Psilocybe cyanescens]|uniref:Uncharacterized protein n=1 Tax=Psilocybe cyanescens TaxID=93625 RepID=A0A409WSN3_PSICY|nr:hypothetical protein CVT25_013328 [Psilocybe cyanescens]
MTEQRNTFRPTQPNTFVFPDETSTGNPAHLVIDPLLRGQPGSGSTRDRSAAGARAASVQPSATTNAAGIKAGPALNKSTAALEIHGLKERVTQLEEENESLKASINKIEHEGKKEKNRLTDELTAIRELIETI